MLAFLTLALIGLMIYSFRTAPETTDTTPQPRPQPETSAPTEPQVTEVGYQAELSAVLEGFPARISQEDNELQQLNMIEDALDGVLALKVPAAYQGLHLRVASNLHNMRQGLKEGTDAFETGLTTIEQLIRETDWLE